MLRFVTAFALFLTGCGADWQVVASKLPGALTCVWGTSSTDVWTVGGDVGDGPMLFHFDGQSWTRHDSGTEGDLWWIHGWKDGPVFFSGAHGTILRRTGDAFERLQTPGDGTVFGLWGSSPTDVWAVGGSGEGGGFAWRFDGTTWRDVPLPPIEGPIPHPAMFKVWGSGPDDVWLVGGSGLVLHWNGESFDEPMLLGDRLLTVHGTGDRFTTVGGFRSGVLFELDGGQWVSRAPNPVASLMGVHLVGADDGWAVGIMGHVYRRQGGVWTRQDTGDATRDDLHSVWVDPEGGVWAAGGVVRELPLVDGVLLHFGSNISTKGMP